MKAPCKRGENNILGQNAKRHKIIYKYELHLQLWSLLVQIPKKLEANRLSSFRVCLVLEQVQSLSTLQWDLMIICPNQIFQGVRICHKKYLLNLFYVNPQIHKSHSKVFKQIFKRKAQSPKTQLTEGILNVLKIVKWKPKI